MLVFVYMVYTHFLYVKIHVQVHFTVASQFYVYINVELNIHAFVHFFAKEKQVC